MGYICIYPHVVCGYTCIVGYLKCIYTCNYDYDIIIFTIIVVRINVIPSYMHVI